MEGFDQIASLLNIPFPTVVTYSIYTLFFLSMYLLLRKINPFFVFLMVISPIFLYHLFNLEFISLSFQLFVFSLALYFLDRNKPLHSFLSSLLLSFLSPLSAVPVSLLYLSRYFKLKERIYLLFSLSMLLFIPYSYNNFDLYIYLIPLMFSLPYVFKYSPLFSVISILFAVFPSSIFFYIYELGNSRLSRDKLIFSIISSSIILSFVNIYYIFLALFALIVEFKSEKYFNTYFYYAISMLFSVVSTYVVYVRRFYGG